MLEISQYLTSNYTIGALLRNNKLVAQKQAYRLMNRTGSLILDKGFKNKKQTLGKRLAL
jgi:hypothetical protein